MISPWLWQVMQIVRIAFLLCFLPVLLYRIWRLWRYPASPPAVAVTCFGAVMWFWLLAFTDMVWSVLPAYVRAASMGGWLVTTIAACVQIFVLGINGSASPARIRRGRRIILAVTAIVLTVITVFVSRSQLLLASKELHTLTNALLDGGDRAAITAYVVGNGYLAVTLVQLIWAGLRHADSTPVGTGLGLLAVASSFELVVVAFGGIWRPLNGGQDFVSVRYGLALQSVSGSAGVTLLTIGFLWPPVVLRIQARRDEKRLRPLHDGLAGLFPQLFPPMELRIRLSDRVFEWSTHIQDGLTLLAQGRQVPLGTDVRAPAVLSERVSGVADWLMGQSVPGFSSEWLQPPEGMSDEAWVLAIADGFRHVRSAHLLHRDRVASCANPGTDDVLLANLLADPRGHRSGGVGA